MATFGIAAGCVILGILGGAFAVSLFVMASDAPPYSPPAPPRCRCGHQPWQHARIQYAEGFALGGCLCTCDCSAYSALWKDGS